MFNTTIARKNPRRRSRSVWKNKTNSGAFDTEKHTSMVILQRCLLRPCGIPCCVIENGGDYHWTECEIFRTLFSSVRLFWYHFRLLLAHFIHVYYLLLFEIHVFMKIIKAFWMLFGKDLRTYEGEMKINAHMRVVCERKEVWKPGCFYDDFMMLIVCGCDRTIMAFPGSQALNLVDPWTASLPWTPFIRRYILVGVTFSYWSSTRTRYHIYSA